ncbi:hypothetical protein [Acinetobacter piscicola]|uniref:hypothetical protein n=1 Tax=Acinetobacter piscicola TaxID=2006115 RepID=UPI0010227179|nr:hypothetical protein [Acinetobacter piscicola]RYL25173.1 hypothetical protein EWP19_13470 [Acinetobacter piscicola]
MSTENEVDRNDLINMFVAATQPEQQTMTLKFKTLNQTVFEIELSVNMSGQFNDQVCELIKASVDAATRTIISAK